MSNKSEFLSETSEMSSVAEATTLIRRAAEPRPVGDSVKGAIRRASYRLGFSFTRTKDIWYGDARRIDADEMDALRKLADRYAGIAQGLRNIDEDFYRDQISALESWSDGTRSLDRTRAGGK